ncbi:Hpt domain-containing protein [Clostridium sp. MCC353]|uniref:Hpt domain-containing protein n=1 Tax=Clostridium sp. MCC353 TaxID=2592646 RepID=UPI001C026BA1|nr:Hpt domain-containing protein [Clostridium sp. MCC353]MBT9778880.1 Hpt domain-containing protein [Clostridium sp. MCC353]
MAVLKEVFQKYGTDYETTMSRFMGSEQMYLKILAMLPRDENLHKLDQALQAGDYPAAFDAAHTLKGMAGNLGLARLYQAVCAIIEPLRTQVPEEDWAVLFQSVKEEFERAAGLVELLKEVE